MARDVSEEEAETLRARVADLEATLDAEAERSEATLLAVQPFLC